MENEAQEIIAGQEMKPRTEVQLLPERRPIITMPCTPVELEEKFKIFLGRFNGEGENLRCELVTGMEGMRFVAVFNWDDMG